jgi:hypothetical protein
VTSAIPTELLSTRYPYNRRSLSRAPRPLVAHAIVGLAIVALVSAGCSNAPAGTGANGDGGIASAAGDQAVKFAQCMRDSGVREFPDPDASGTLTIETVTNGTSIDTDSASFQRAITACKDLEPPGFTGFARTPEQQQAALTFAQCIRDKGVRDFPDPAIDQPMIDTNRIPSTDTPGGMTILHAAMEKCGTYARDAGVTR